jgi:ubiquinone biosynthesis protein
VSRLKGDEEDRSQEASSNSLEGFVTALFSVAHHHRVYVPPSTTLFIKTLVTIEGVARSLNPELNLVTVALPVVLRSLFPRWMRWILGPKGWGARLGPAEKAGWEGSQTPTAA